MTFNATETSRHEGSPVELYDFTHGATHYRYTSAAVAREYDGETYEPAAITRDQINQSQEDNAGNIVVTVPRDNAVAALHVPYLPTQKVGLIIRRLHRLDEDEEAVVAFTGSVLSMKYESEGSRSMLTCGPITEGLRKTIPIVLYQPQCNYALYSPGCGVDKEAFKVTATITAIVGNTISADEFGDTTTPSGWFNNGWIQFGDDTRWVVDHIGDTIVLMSPFPTLAVDDVVDAYPGCNRDEATCLTKFANLDNHLGFSRIPLVNPFETSVEY